MSLQGQPLQVLFFSYLLVLPEQEVDHTFEDLLVFVTGADCLSATTGVPKVLQSFYDQEPGLRCILYAYDMQLMPLSAKRCRE